jgi:putative DNA primase/helicase
MIENNFDKIEMFSAAQVYHELGIPVIPFKVTQKDNGEYEKKNLASWGKWQTETQTSEEFNSLNWTDANAYGILLGTKSTNGYYLTVIDYDVKGKVTDTVKEVGKNVLNELPLTRIEQTVNKGLHYIYWNNSPISTDGTFHDTAGLELLGTRKLCLMAPSYGYSITSGDNISYIENLNDCFYQVLKKHNQIHSEENEVEHQLDSYGVSIGKIIDLNKLQKKDTYNFQGSHPTHDSTTEQNFCVNTKDNTWHCFRHNSGGGGLQLLAVKEGIIECEQAKKGALRGKKFKQVLALAVSQGLIDEKALEQSNINPILLAKDIMIDYNFVTDSDENKLFYWIKEQGIYSDNTEQLIKREIARRIDENFRASYYNEINEFITASAPLVEMNATNPELLAVKNGLLNVFTKELKPYNKDIYITSKLDWNFNANGKNPRFTKFMNDVLPDKKQQRQVQQLIGHCLYRKIITETCLILYGEGGNGKSIFLDTIKTLLGKKNISGHSIQALCYDKFTLETIQYKLANICTDLPHKELINTGSFRALVSGDAIETYQKHVQATKTILPYTKCLFSANHIPTITNEEDSNAWYRRFIIVDFNQIFTGNTKIPRQILLGMLQTPEEMEGTLLWAINGLTELHENGEVTDKPNSDEIRKLYRERSSTTLSYFDKQVQITNTETDFVFTDDWFRDYVTYCNLNNKKAKNKNQFILDVEVHLPGAYKTRIRQTPKQSPLAAFRYVKLVQSVPAVPAVPDFQTLSAQNEKNTLFKKTVLEQKNPESTVQPVQMVQIEENSLKAEAKQFLEEEKQRAIDEKKPKFYIKDIPAGEKCEGCNSFCVTKEVITPNKEVLRRCDSCVNHLKQTFGNAVFHVAYPDLDFKEDF